MLQEIQLFFLNALCILLFASCSGLSVSSETIEQDFDTSLTPISSPVNLTTTTPSVSATDTSLSVTATASNTITSTVERTLGFDNLQEVLFRFPVTDMSSECDICWHGLEVGVSTEEDVYSTIETLFGPEQTSQITEQSSLQLDFTEYKILRYSVEGDGRFVAFFALEKSNKVLQGLYILSEGDVSILDILSVYGEPSYSYLYLVKPSGFIVGSVFVYTNGLMLSVSAERTGETVASDADVLKVEHCFDQDINLIELVITSPPQNPDVLEVHPLQKYWLLPEQSREPINELYDPTDFPIEQVMGMLDGQQDTCLVVADE